MTNFWRSVRKLSFLKFIYFIRLGFIDFDVTLLVVAIITMLITATMVRVTANDGLGTDLVGPTGLGPITVGLLVGPQVLAVTGGALPLQAPERPLVSFVLRQCKIGMRLFGVGQNIPKCLLFCLLFFFFCHNLLEPLRITTTWTLQVIYSKTLSFKELVLLD